MSKAEKFIAEHTNDGSNELCSVEDINGKHILSYREWLMPEQALEAVKIEREETIERVIKWIKENRLSFYEGDVLGGSPRFRANKFYNALRKAMEG